MARILVVDDDKDIVQVIKHITQQDHHEVIHAYNGRNGLKGAIENKPDLIILDIMMPELDGMAVSRLLLCHPATQSIPVIILTAKDMRRDALVEAANIHSYVKKPFAPEMLQEQIHLILHEAQRKAA